MMSSYWQRFHLGTILCFSFALIYSLYNYLPLLDAKWSIIDDHEIISVIGARNRLPILEIPNALSKTEVGKMGTETRFRPSYYSIRYFEAAIWGKQPALWYASRIAIFSFFAFVLTTVCLHMGGPILTFGFLAFELSRSYWSNIFGCLGPAEAYAVLGVSLTIIGFIVADKKSWSMLPCVLVTAGIIIAAGSKENFAVLAVLPIWLILSPTLRLSLKLKSIIAIGLAYITWISVVVINGLRHVGHDVYAQPISVESRFIPLYAFVTRTDILVLLITSLLLLAFIFMLWKRDINIQEKNSLKSLNNYALAMLAMLALILFQHLFYGSKGHWPIDVSPRYLFPGMIAEHITVFLLFVVIVKLVCIKFRRLSRYVWVIYLSGALTFLTFTAGNIDFGKKIDNTSFNKQSSIEKIVSNITLNREASIKMVAKTKSFTSKLDEAFIFLRAHPSAALILNSNSVRDYETVFSIKRFVLASGLTNPVALSMSGYSINSFSNDNQKLQFLLTTNLEKVKNSGKGGFVPLSALVIGTKCFSMGMSGSPLERCEASNIIWP